MFGVVHSEDKYLDAPIVGANLFQDVATIHKGSRVVGYNLVKVLSATPSDKFSATLRLDDIGVWRVEQSLYQSAKIAIFGVDNKVFHLCLL